MLQVVRHPLDPQIWTVARDGQLIPACNGCTVKSLHTVFRTLVIHIKSKSNGWISGHTGGREGKA